MGANYDVSNSKPLLIGFGEQNYFTGVLDDMRIYRGALDAVQVEKLYNQNKAREEKANVKF